MYICITSDSLAVNRRGSLIKMSSRKVGVVFPVVLMLQQVEATEQCLFREKLQSVADCKFHNNDCIFHDPLPLSSGT